MRGADAVARTFAGRARAARLALVDGAVGLVWSQGGQPRVVTRRQQPLPLAPELNGRGP